MDRMCRICSDINAPKLDIFELTFGGHPLPYLMLRYLYLKVEKEDKLTQKICGQCLVKITDIHKFAQLAAEMQELLIQLAAEANEKEPAGLAVAESMEIVQLPNNEEDTDCLAPLIAEERGDSPINNFGNIKYPYKTSDEAKETQEEHYLKLGSYGNKEITSGKLLKNLNLANKRSLESGNLNERQREEEVTILNIVSEVDVTTSSDHISDDPIEVTNASLSSDIQTEGENTVTVTQIKESCVTTSPDDTLELNCEQQKNISRNQKNNISPKHLSEKRKIEKKLFTNIQISLYKCLHCDFNISEKNLLEEHIDRCHNKTEYECDVCKKVFLQKKILYNHVVHHVGVNRYFCKTCKKGFITKTQLKNHCWRKHEEEVKLWKCKICKKTFDKNAKLIIHMSQHRDLTYHRYKCPVCKTTYASKYNLKWHMIDVHKTTSSYNCAICDRRFLMKKTLKSHMYSHLTLIKPFRCEICNEGFMTNKLNRHSLTKKHQLNLRYNSKAKVK